MLSGQARVSPTLYYGMGWFFKENASSAIPGSGPHASYNEIVREKGRSLVLRLNSQQRRPRHGLDDLAGSMGYIIGE